jgi:hypothetical protein
VEAAGAISNTAVATVRDVLVGIAGGIKDVAGAVLPKTSKTGAPGES